MTIVYFSLFLNHSLNCLSLSCYHEKSLLTFPITHSALYVDYYICSNQIYFFVVLKHIRNKSPFNIKLKW